MDPAHHGTVIDFPLRGEWLAVRSPGHPRYAFDFAAVGGPKRRYFSTHRLRVLLGRVSVVDSYSWSAPVHAPFDGEIVRVCDGRPDRTTVWLIRDAVRVLRTGLRLASVEENLRAFAGNHIVLRAGAVHAFMAHLRRESLRARVGQDVRRGEVVGEVGNSGNSLAPHLHFQLLDDIDLFTARTLPFRFRKYERWNGTSWKPVDNAVPEKGDRVRALAV